MLLVAQHTVAMNTPALKSVLAAHGIKTFSDFAGRIGVDKSTVTRWAQKGVPADRLIELERVTGIPRTAFRPDLYEATQ